MSHKLRSDHSRNVKLVMREFVTMSQYGRKTVLADDVVRSLSSEMSRATVYRHVVFLCANGNLLPVGEEVRPDTRGRRPTQYRVMRAWVS